MHLRLSPILVLPLLVACGESAQDNKKQQPVADAGQMPSTFGSGGAQAGTGGASAAGGSPVSTSSGGTLGSGGSVLGSGGSGVAPGTGGSGAIGTGGSSGAGDSGSPSGGDGGGSDAGPTPCTSDGDCAAPSRFCDVGHGVCVECLSDNHCPQGQTCGLADHVCKYACTT